MRTGYLIPVHLPVLIRISRGLTANREERASRERDFLSTCKSSSTTIRIPPRAHYDLDPSSVAYTRFSGLFRSRPSRQRSVVNASRKDGRAAAGVRGRTMAY